MKTPGSKGFEIQNLPNVAIIFFFIGGDDNLQIRVLGLTWKSVFLDVQLNIPKCFHDVYFSFRNNFRIQDFASNISKFSVGRDVP